MGVGVGSGDGDGVAAGVVPPRQAVRIGMRRATRMSDFFNEIKSKAS
jgi:hypothetical protein